MDADRDRNRERPVRVHTTFGTFEASLACSPGMRVLDAVNQLSSTVVVLRLADVSALGPPFRPGRLTIVKSSVLFVEELEAPSPTSGGRPRCRFWQASVALRVGEFVIEGLVHVPVGGDPLLRVHQGGRVFLALTSVVATGPGSEFEAPFLAVNRAHIAAAQELRQGEKDSAMAPEAEAEAEPAEVPVP